MNTAARRGLEAKEGALSLTFASLDRENRTAVDTECAAYHLSRKPQTLRIWASRENGPLRPLRVHGRLLWPVAELRRLVGA